MDNFYVFRKPITNVYKSAGTFDEIVERISSYPRPRYDKNMIPKLDMIHKKPLTASAQMEAAEREKQLERERLERVCFILETARVINIFRKNEKGKRLRGTLISFYIQNLKNTLLLMNLVPMIYLKRLKVCRSLRNLLKSQKKRKNINTETRNIRRKRIENTMKRIENMMKRIGRRRKINRRRTRKIKRKNTVSCFFTF